MQVIATAGNVDHGKSALVRALTGMEPDRWEAERRRGLTIDLGYAWTTLPSAAISLPELLAVPLRRGEPAVVGRLEAGRLLLDLRSVDPADDDRLVAAVLAAASGH